MDLQSLKGGVIKRLKNPLREAFDGWPSIKTDPKKGRQDPFNGESRPFSGQTFFREVV